MQSPWLLLQATFPMRQREGREVAPAFRTAGLVGGSLLRMALNGAEHDEDTTED